MLSSGKKLDSRAIELAQEALVSVREHQKYCVEKDKILIDALKDVQESIETLHTRVNDVRTDMVSSERRQNSRVFGVVGATILLLLSIIGYLLIAGRPWVSLNPPTKAKVYYGSSAST